MLPWPRGMDLDSVTLQLDRWQRPALSKSSMLPTILRVKLWGPRGATEIPLECPCKAPVVVQSSDAQPQEEPPASWNSGMHTGGGGVTLITVRGRQP